MNILLRNDLDLLDLIQFHAQPVDRLSQADIISYCPNLIGVKDKIIIVNKYYSGCERELYYLSENNKIINRLPNLADFSYQPYDETELDIVSTNSEEVDITFPKLQLVLLDDLIISNYALKF